MDKLSKIQREKIDAAYRLLTEEATSFGKFENWQGVNRLPPLTVAVDGSRRDLITISTLGLSMNYELGGEGINLVFDGESLIGKRTTINLGESKTHELVIKCQ